MKPLINFKIKVRLLTGDLENLEEDTSSMVMSYFEEYNSL